MLSDLIRQDLPNKLNKDPNAIPSANLYILCNMFDKLKSKYFPVVVNKLTNTNIRNPNGLL